MSELHSHLDRIMHSPSYSSVPKELRMAGTAGIALVHVDQEPADYHRPGGRDFCLNVITTHDNPMTVDHGVRFDCRTTTGCLVLAPCDTDLAYDIRSDLSGIIAIIPEQTMRAAIEMHTGRPWAGDFGVLHASAFEDELVRALVMRLWDEAARGSPGGVLFADSAAQTLALALAAASGQLLGPPPLTRGGLAPWQVHRVEALMREHLTEDLTLAELAASVGLSPYHFARAFKAVTGVPPHRYQMRLRVEHAKDLLTSTDQSVTEIAHACGFASSQHMATVFRRLIFTSPSEYRRGSGTRAPAYRRAEPPPLPLPATDGRISASRTDVA